MFMFSTPLTSQSFYIRANIDVLISRYIIAIFATADKPLTDRSPWCWCAGAGVLVKWLLLLPLPLPLLAGHCESNFKCNKFRKYHKIAIGTSVLADDVQVCGLREVLQLLQLLLLLLLSAGHYTDFTLTQCTPAMWVCFTRCGSH